MPGRDREEPPLVIGLVNGGFARLEDAVRWCVASLNRRIQLTLWAAGSIGLFAAVLVMSVVQSPGLAGFGRGIVLGLFLGLGFAAAFGWLLMWANGSRTRDPADDAATVTALDDLLAPTVRELNVVRAEVIRNVKARSVTRVPLGIAATLAVWVLAQWTDDPPGFFELIAFAVIGALAGEIWAAGKLEREYTRLYKDRVLPTLAARLGNLTYKQASASEIQRLSAHRILPEYDNLQAEDEISGTHRGLPLAIVEARLTRRSGEDTQVAFDGLLIDLTLPRRLTGTTVVLADRGIVGNLEARWRSQLEPVTLEDPRFEERFDVYGSDQIEARALLTPAFMERFVGLAAHSGFALPGALAEGNRLVIALPKSLGTGDLFEPPVYWKPAGGRALLKLEQDIRAVLGIADVVIDLDFWAAGHGHGTVG